jgi:hypothetical protein
MEIRCWGCDVCHRKGFVRHATVEAQGGISGIAPTDNPKSTSAVRSVLQTKIPARYLERGLGASPSEVFTPSCQLGLLPRACLEVLKHSLKFSARCTQFPARVDAGHSSVLNVRGANTRVPDPSPIYIPEDVGEESEQFVEVSTRLRHFALGFHADLIRTVSGLSVMCEPIYSHAVESSQDRKAG